MDFDTLNKYAFIYFLIIFLIFKANYRSYDYKEHFIGNFLNVRLSVIIGRVDHHSEKNKYTLYVYIQ